MNVEPEVSSWSRMAFTRKSFIFVDNRIYSAYLKKKNRDGGWQMKIKKTRPVGGGAGGSKGPNEPPLEVNNGGLKTLTADF